MKALVVARRAACVTLCLLPLGLVVTHQVRGEQPEADDAAARVLSESSEGQGRVDCPKFLGNWRPLAEIDLSVETAAEVPNCASGLFRPEDAGTDRRIPWAPTQFTWAASELYYQPLYFDDTPLERYGQSAPRLLQPWLSGVHFFACFPLMPYKLGLDRTHERIYTLGYYRPGSPAPAVRRRLPWELDAALLEVGVWSAVFLVLIP